MSHRFPADSTPSAVAKARLQLYLDHQYTAAVRFAGKFFPLKEDAEDAVSEASFRAIRAAHQYDPAKNFDAWFTHILKMVCLEMLRARSAKKVPKIASGEAQTLRGDALDSITLLEAQIDPDTDVESGVLESGQGCWIEGVFVSKETARALLMLNPIARAVVVHLYMENPVLSQAEAAAKLGLSESQVKSIAREARKQLAVLLGMSFGGDN